MWVYSDVQTMCRRDVARFRSVPVWLAFRCLPVALAATLVLLLLFASTARGETFTPEQVFQEGVSGGRLLLRATGEEDYTGALQQGSDVRMAISGLVATVRLEQTFKNDTAAFVEALYVFPLPETAAVRYMEMQIGERRIVGKVREKAEARQLYEQARRAGKKASLVSQQRPNLFTNRVANIAPGESVAVVLEYVQGVDYDAGEFSLRFPMTITPRYMPGRALASGDLEDPENLAFEAQGGWALPTHRVPDAHQISPPLNPRLGNDNDPINAITLAATLDMGMPLANVESAYHDIALSRRAGVYSIALANGVSEMDRDFVLTWRPVTGSEPQAALFTENVEGMQYGLLMVVPPAGAPRDTALNREIVFIIDTSGSMGGVSIEQARASLVDALERLGPDDRFNVIEFNSSHASLFRNAVPATRSNILMAKGFVQRLNASGGTEMLPALRAALMQRRDPDLLQSGTAVRQVIFITDGAVGNEAELFRAVAEHLGDTRLFTVGIGSAPNSFFMRKAAEVGRGSHTHIGKLDEVGLKMGALFEKLARPAALDIQIDWPAGAEAWPPRVPDLYYGEPLSVTVKLPVNYAQDAITVRGKLGGRDWSRRIGIADVAGDGESADGVATLWARRKISALLDRGRAGVPEEETRSEVLKVALAHQLLSPYTSFIAIEELISRPEGEGLARKALANSRPRGQSEQGFAFPAGATSGPAKVWFGIFGLFVSLLLHLLRREEVDFDV